MYIQQKQPLKRCLLSDELWWENVDSICMLLLVCAPVRPSIALRFPLLFTQLSENLRIPRWNTAALLTA